MIEVKTKQVEAVIYHQAKRGNHESGDAYFTHAEADYFIFAIADGLGNGPVARQSAEIIPNMLSNYHAESIDELLNRCNEYMIQKRGAAVAIVKVDFINKTIEYSCVGNVRFYISRKVGGMVYPLPVRGYLAGRPLKLNTQSYNYDPGDRFFLHSDGVEVNSPASILKQHGSLIELYNRIVHTSNVDDDATFIAGNLLQ